VSGDEITFGDMKLREPDRRHRPDRDRKFAALAYEVPGPNDLPIFLDSRAADAIERHALSDTAVELGGILLGKECQDPSTGQPFVWITQSLEAKHYANTQASFTYTHDSWAEITRERDLRYPQYDVVGWYHTHPSFGIFLSHHDLFIHQHFFAQPLQVAYVVDPINQTRGFFQWRDGGMAQVTGYFVTAARADRVALARLVNELERFPSSEGTSGGGLSPRLEAELINMLTRPAQREYTQPAERFQIAAVFSLLGAILGILGLAAALWLYQIQGRLEFLTRSVEQSSASQHLVSDIIKRAKLEKAADFNALYDETAAERDEARRQLENQRNTNDTLSNESKELKAKLADRDERLGDALKSLGDYQKVAPDPGKLREKIADFEESERRQTKELKELRILSELPEGKKVLDIEHQLTRATIAAYVGWGFSVFLVLALVTVYFYPKPSDDPASGDATTTDAAPEQPAPDENERPTHRIV
jgi:proteasome lid subunit RPN8/RPN11